MRVGVPNRKQSIFFWTNRTRQGIYRIFDCRFPLLNIGIMQKLLNTPHFALYSLWLRMFSTVRIRLSAALTLLLMVGLSSSVMAAAGFDSNTIVIGGSGSNNGTYNISAFSNTNTPKGLGTYNRNNNDQLNFGALSTTTEAKGNENVNSVQVLYRVYLASASSTVTDVSPAFVALPLSTTDKGKTKNWTSNNSVNLVNSTSAGGSYIVEFFVQLNYSSQSSSSILFSDNNGNNNYKASFTVINTQSATWNGSVSNDWHDGSNWTGTNGAEPTKDTDVTIAFVSGAPAAYYPVVGYGIAKVRTLTIQGTSINTQGGRVFLRGTGELQVFGNFQDPNAGLLQTGGIFTLAGTTQTFDGESFVEVHIQGGGVKTLSNKMDVSVALRFINENGGGILSTRTDNSVFYSVDLDDPAVITGEIATSYVSGFLRTPAWSVTTASNSFGGIGVILTANGGNPGRTTVTRLTGFAYTGPVGFEVGSKNTSVKRSFAFAPLNSNNLNFTLVFQYLDSELNGLNASNLKLERSVTGSAPFENLGSNGSVANQVTVNSISGTLASPLLPRRRVRHSCAGLRPLKPITVASASSGSLVAMALGSR